MIKHRPISEASDDCPFHTLDTNGQSQCFIKYITNQNIISSIINRPTRSPQEPEWNSDCAADWHKCFFLPILYELVETNAEEASNALTSIEEFEPFEEYKEDKEEESEEVHEELPREKKENKNPEIRVGITKVSDPYIVKGADVLVIPTSQSLLIDDDLLNRRSQFRIQDECDLYVDKMDIKQGSVYPTSNGGDSPGGVVPKRIYHAVVAGVSKLVSHNIQSATLEALYLADHEGAKVVAMLPFDCGILDISEGARLQLTAIYDFVYKTEVKNIKKIHILMEDDESIEVFREYFERIFGED